MISQYLCFAIFTPGSMVMAEKVHYHDHYLNFSSEAFRKDFCHRNTIPYLFPYRSFYFKLSHQHLHIHFDKTDELLIILSHTSRVACIAILVLPLHIAILTIHNSSLEHAWYNTTMCKSASHHCVMLWFAP